MKALAAEGVGTRPFFFPMHRQPVFERLGLADGRPRPVAEQLAARGFYLPSGLGLDDAVPLAATQALRQILRQQVGASS